MKAYRVLITPTAYSDIANAFQHILRDAPDEARRWILDLFHAIDTLDRFPNRCPAARENLYFDNGLRHLLYRSHRIIFRIEEAQAIVRVLYVRHMAQCAIGEPGCDDADDASGV